MANIYKGVGVHWGVTSSGATAFGTMKLQTRDHTLKSDMDTIRDADGVTVAKIYYDPTQEASFEYIPTGASGGAVTPTLPTIGDVVTVTDSTYTQIAATNWLVDDVSTRSSNTGVMRVTIRMTRYPQITS